ncbi:hypothetical protein DDZ14_01385 [Maritimibacter sp. 55A14]|nr:hypothetical protein DDZ14_01385 [Maritimibacter sp. 55A14]
MDLATACRSGHEPRGAKGQTFAYVSRQFEVTPAPASAPGARRRMREAPDQVRGGAPIRRDRLQDHELRIETEPA